MKIFLYPFIGFCFPLLCVMAYFQYHGALKEFVYYTTIFNFNVMKTLSKSPYLDHYKSIFACFLVKDRILTFLSLLSIFFTVRRSKEFALITTVIIFSSYGLLKGLAPYYAIMFLPLLSIVVTSFFKDYVLKQFLNEAPSLFILCIVLMIFFLQTKVLPINFDKKTQAFLDSREEIKWALSNTARDEIISTNWNSGMAYVFNEDPQYFWVRQDEFVDKKNRKLFEKGYLETLKNKKVRVISSYRQNLVKDTASNVYIRTHYRPLCPNKKNNSIWLLKEEDNENLGN